MAATTSQHFTELSGILTELLSRWAGRKYKRLRGRQRKAQRWLRQFRNRQSWLFAHWRFAYTWAGR